jgi:membrane protease YdiL (CAAX protease family)
MRLLPATELTLLLRQPSYSPRSSWGPFEAFAVTALIFLVCSFLLPLCIYGLSPDAFRIVSKQIGPSKFGYVILLIDQIATTILVLVAAGMHGGSRSAVLRLGPAKGGLLTSVLLASSAYLIIRLVEAALPIHVQGIQQASVIQPAWWLPWIILTVLIIGAPVSEELLFRGFLLSALTKSRAGFWGRNLKYRMDIHTPFLGLDPNFNYFRIRTVTELHSFADREYLDMRTCAWHGQRITRRVGVMSSV